MKVDNALIEKMAKLSKLRFSGEDMETMKQDMEKMIAFVDKLNELDTEGIEPLIHISDEVNVLREDEANNASTQEEALKNAPQKDSDFIKVPKVIS